MSRIIFYRFGNNKSWIKKKTKNNKRKTADEQTNKKGRQKLFQKGRTASLFCPDTTCDQKYTGGGGGGGGGVCAIIIS